MEAREAAQEAQMLSNIQKALTPEVVESILTDQIALKQRQVSMHARPNGFLALDYKRMPQTKEYAK